MGKILYIDTFTKPKEVSQNLSIPVNSNKPGKPNNNPFQKNTFNFAETDKYLDYFSISSWLNKRKENRKYRINR